MENRKLFRDFSNVVNSLNNKVCWDVIFSERTGAAILFELGEKKVIKQKKIKKLNRNLLSDEYAFEGEFNLYIQCYWEIYYDSKERCNSNTFDFQQLAMVEYVDNLKNTIIEKIQIKNFDLYIKFNNGFSINILTAIQEWENYSIQTPKGLFIIDDKQSLKYRDEV